jgi:hypothetical protein
VHGPILLEQQARLGVYRERKATTVEDMEAAFAASRARPKTSVVAEVASQQGEVPEAEEARLLGVQAFDADRLVADVQRTNPSRAIPKVDRSDRLGEDPELVARLNAERDAAADAEVDVERVVKERLERRGELAGLLDDLDAMLED